MCVLCVILTFIICCTIRFIIEAVKKQKNDKTEKNVSLHDS